MLLKHAYILRIEKHHLSILNIYEHLRNLNTVFMEN